MKSKKSIKIRCVHNWGNNKECLISPVYYERHVGLQWKVIKGEYSGSMFTCKIDKFSLNVFWKIIVSIIELHYFLKKDLSKTIRLCLLNVKKQNNLPF